MKKKNRKRRKRIVEDLITPEFVDLLNKCVTGIVRGTNVYITFRHPDEREMKQFLDAIK